MNSRRFTGSPPQAGAPSHYHTVARGCCCASQQPPQPLCKLLPSVSGINSMGAPNCPLLDGLIGRRPDAASRSVQPRGRDPRCARFRPGRAAQRLRALSRRSKVFGETALTASYSITSSARASSMGGTSSPSALAVLRLMTRSNLVGCTTGKLWGFSPLRILPT
jgi:hypothetical protein